MCIRDRYYAANVSSLKLRFRLALLLSVILCWISFGLPTAGALGHDLKTTSLVCLALELSVVMLGLDIFTKGIMSLVRNRPGLWTLVSFSCVASALDAVVSYAVGTAGWGLPFCGAAALSMTFAIWGAQLTSRGLRLSCKAQELAEDPFCVSAETGVLDEGAAPVSYTHLDVYKRQARRRHAEHHRLSRGTRQVGLLLRRGRRRGHQRKCPALPF